MRRTLRRVRSLQARLVIASVVLMTMVSIVVGAGAAIALDRYLTDQLDRQAFELSGFLAGPPPGGPDRPPPPNAGGGVGGGPGRPLNTLEVRVADGRVVRAALTERRGSSVPMPAAEAAPAIAVTPGDGPVSIDVGDEHYRAVARSAGDGTVVVVGLNTEQRDGTVAQLVIAESVIFGLGVLVAGVLSAYTTRLTLRPLHRVSATARRVAELPLSQGDVELVERVPSGLTDTRSEVGQMGAALNRLLGHVGAALTARHESETRLRRFVADASHELRTPLAAIRGYSELAGRRSAELPPEVAALLERVGSQTERMTALVEDLLLLARLDAGRPLARESVDLVGLVADAVTDAHVAAPDHHWSLEVPDDSTDGTGGGDPGFDANFDVTGDRERLHQVVANLLANARTHTPAGTTVVVRLLRRGSRVRLEVGDDGPGIPSELLPHVFERFARGDSGRARTTGSTGLGLSIVAAVVQEHGGTIDVTSTPGDTRFRVDLPAGRPEPAPDGPATVRTSDLTSNDERAGRPRPAGPGVRRRA
jgi:two-component system OmpR family sensor kinase